jgi:hypothetical protein
LEEEKDMVANAYMPHRIAKMTMNSMFRCYWCIRQKRMLRSNAVALEQAQKDSRTYCNPALGEMSVASGNFLIMENLQDFEGLSVLEESAVRLNEIYKCLLTGGFTEDEALTLIAKMTKSGPNP